MPHRFTGLLAAVSLLILVGCGGGSGSNSSTDTLSGKWNGGTITLHSSQASGWSESLSTFTIIVNGDQVSANANDEYWNWGPATFNRSGNHITASDIPEQEGGSTVKLSLDLTLENDDLLDGTVSIDWWDATHNEYFPSSSPISAVK